MSFQIGRTGPPSPPPLTTLGVVRTPSAEAVEPVAPVRKLDEGDAPRQDLLYGAVRVSISAKAQALNSAFRAGVAEQQANAPLAAPPN